ncbi:DUF1566 domain-containing protein [Pseudomonas putida]|uniref:DUF1566 domain-containing protein n=1 Tax=Pseudomonas putida TaxID=303 RepID=UPI00215FD80D|nr:DUF1566 domain-containing protein [Pseudomonas putida]UVL76580.1 DUF1566 domain-containing protein [Pseudomonas putida]
MNTKQKPTPPAIGEVWDGQGGIYAGIIPARDGAEAYHLVIGEELGRFSWGPNDVEAQATSLDDGEANTVALLEYSDVYPAAKAAAAHQADGHSDFYLPAIAEVHRAWNNLGGQPWGLVWSSSLRPDNSAAYLDFIDGYQGSHSRDGEHIVRPARRLPVR